MNSNLIRTINNKVVIYVTLLLAVVNLQAAEVTWNINGGTFADDGQFSGQFIFDEATQKITSWQISISGGNTDRFPEIVFTPQNSSAAKFNLGNSEDTIQFQATGDSNRQLRITPTIALTDAGGIISLNLNTARGQSGGVECYNCAPTRLITGGELATITIGTPPILTPKPEGLSGLWFDPMLEGEGYNVINAANGMIVYYYGYSAGGQRLWLLSDLYTQAVEFGKDIELGVAEFKGGTFLLPLGSQMASSGWGTLTINFLSCDKATFTLVGVDGNKTSQVVKLAGIVNTDC